MDQLALGLIIALVPLILAALSYATFRQPVLARKALVILIILDIVYFAGVYSAEFGARQGYTKSLQVLSGDSTMVYNPLEDLTTGRIDSLKVYMNMKSSLDNLAYENILYEMEKDIAYTQHVRVYCLVLFAVFIIFFILSFLFETMKLGEKLSSKNPIKEANRYNPRQ